jgi:hypothetical protein
VSARYINRLNPIRAQHALWSRLADAINRQCDEYIAAAQPVDWKAGRAAIRSCEGGAMARSTPQPIGGPPAGTIFAFGRPLTSLAVMKATLCCWRDQALRDIPESGIAEALRHMWRAAQDITAQERDALLGPFQWRG